jgi:uncharacterized UBP type Zn finger protein
MPRTTPGDVKTIFETDLSDSTIQEWIDVATLIVDDIEDADSSITNTRLERIEKLLSAHFAGTQDQRIAQTSAESKSVEFQGDTEMTDLRGTKYGQNAIALDPTGTLSTLGKPTATLSVPKIKET